MQWHFDAVIVLGGHLEDGPFLPEFLAYLRQQPIPILAVDSGAEFCHRHGLLIQSLIGDMDSISAELQANLRRETGLEVLQFPSRKDETDGELAFLYLSELGAKSILVLAGLSAERADHVWMNLALCQAHRTKKRQVVLSDGRSCIWPVQGGDDLSFHFPFSRYGRLAISLTAQDCLTGIDYEGLAYPLHQATIQMGSSRGMSNYLATYDEPEVQDERCVCRLKLGSGRGFWWVGPQD